MTLSAVRFPSRTSQLTISDTADQKEKTEQHTRARIHYTLYSVGEKTGLFFWKFVTPVYVDIE